MITIYIGILLSFVICGIFLYFKLKSLDRNIYKLTNEIEDIKFKNTLQLYSSDNNVDEYDCNDAMLDTKIIIMKN